VLGPDWLRGSSGGLGASQKGLRSSNYSKIDLASRCELAGKSLAREKKTTLCSRLSIVPFATGPKRTMGHVLGAEKEFFLIRGRGRPTVYDGRASGILSIRGPEVSRGSPRVGTIHVHATTPHTPPLQSFLVDFSQQAAEE